MRQPSDSHQTAIRQSSDSRQAVIRQSSDSHHSRSPDELLDEVFDALSSEEPEPDFLSKVISVRKASRALGRFSA
jgi:hypothetical protein